MPFNERAFHGIRNFSGEEATNLILGQGRFDIINGGPTASRKWYL